MARVPRKLRPRPPVALRPLAISQLNVEASFGINDRRYLELLPELDIDVTSVGKLRIVQADDFAAALRERATKAETVTTNGSEIDDDEQPKTVDGFLALVGRRAS